MLGFVKLFQEQKYGGKKKRRMEHVKLHENQENGKLSMSTQGLLHFKMLHLDQNETLWFFCQWLDFSFS